MSITLLLIIMFLCWDMPPMGRVLILAVVATVCWLGLVGVVTVGLGVLIIAAACFAVWVARLIVLAIVRVLYRGMVHTGSAGLRFGHRFAEPLAILVLLTPLVALSYWYYGLTAG